MPESGRQTLAATLVKLRQKIQQIKERKENCSRAEYESRSHRTAGHRSRLGYR